MKITNKYMKKSLIMLAIKEIQIKTTIRYDLSPVRWLKFKALGVTNASEDTEEREHSLYTVNGNVN